MAMRRAVRHGVQAIFGLALALATGGCGGSSDDPAPLNVVHVSADIVAPESWVAGNLYVIDNAIQISATLTIAPGTIVKLSPSTALQVVAGGAIVADGSASKRIYFTSLADDAHGGDTNGDGSATSPAPGDWNSVSVAEDGSVFDSCLFLYGGGNMPYGGTLVLSGGAVATVTHCTFAHNQGGTPADTRAAALHAGGAGPGTVLTWNLFYDNDLPLVVNRAYDLDDTNTFHAATVGNAYDGIFFDGPYSQAGDVTWSATEVPYVILQPLAVPGGSTLTLGDGVVLKFDADQRIDVAGALVADGTTGGILFTSFLDDAALGDTNGDGSATSAAPGDWRGLAVSGSGSVFDQCTLRYGGSAPTWGTLTVTAGGTPTITSNLFTDNAGGTLLDHRGAALHLAGAGAGTVVTGNRFAGNVVPLVINGAVGIDGSNLFHGGVASDPNTYNGIFMDGTSHTINGAVTWSNSEVPYMVLNGTVLTIAAGGTLTLGNDVVVKLGGGRIDWSGTLVQGTGTFFTSWRDDTLKGDSNGDGNATSPVKGDWTGINDCVDGSCAYSPALNILFAANPP